MINDSITIWVYEDEGVSEASVKSILSTFKTKLSVERVDSIQLISSDGILSGQLTGKGCLVLPGGADLPYCKKLNGRGNAVIKRYVSEGNAYVGICAGGYYGARDIDFIGDGYEIKEERELSFFSGTAIGSIKNLTKDRLYNGETSTKAMVPLHYGEELTDSVYYHGGAFFDGHSDATFTSLATYSDGRNAVVKGDYGKGSYMLTGVHFELCPHVYERIVIGRARQTDMNDELALLESIQHPKYGRFLFDEVDLQLSKI